MPKKKSAPAPAQPVDPVESQLPIQSVKPVAKKPKAAVKVNTVEEEKTAVTGNITGDESIMQPAISGAIERHEPGLKWLQILVSAFLGILAGFLLGYFLVVKPLQDQLIFTAGINNTGKVSSSQIKSDLSNTRLRQQEMETRYQTAAAQLESANQYIFLLRMKEQVILAQLKVEQKEGLEARKALAEMKTLFDHLKPYILKKDPVSAEKLESLIQTTIQDLTSDPASASTDLNDISTSLEKVETSLFQME